MNSIERDILIEAPAEVVWGIVTEADQLASWFCDAAELDLRPGGKGVLTWTDRATNAEAVIQLQVEAVDPPRMFSFRWVDSEILVEFTLTAEGDKTRLRVVESGIDQVEWSDAEKAEYRTTHEKGWDQHLGALVDYVADRR